MSLNYYSYEENYDKQKSISSYQNIFIKYINEPLNLSTSLKQMYICAVLLEEKSNELIEDIIKKDKDK